MQPLSRKSDVLTITALATQYLLNSWENETEQIPRLDSPRKWLSDEYLCTCLCVEQMLPELRETLFGRNASRKFFD